MSRRAAARAGFTVVEALTALLVLLLLLNVGWSVTAAMGRAAAELAERGESLAASRAASWILQEELAGVRAPADLAAPAGDSLALRAFRGAALVCGLRTPTELLVRWSGIRAPDPTKDSLLVLDADGEWSVRALSRRSAEPRGCVGAPGPIGDVEERWTIDREVGAPVLLRYFERGSYHLSDAALRYRIGAGGRQPLTPETLDPVASSLTGASPDLVILQLATRGSHLGRRGPAVRRTFAVSGGW
jgi:hypothetical protein